MTVGYRFGNFELQPDQRRLLAGGRPLAVGQRAFDVLQALIERRDRLVGKSELLDLVWPGLVVEENNLQVQISALRKLLGPQAIATVPGRGYRFAAVLDDAPPGGGPAATAAAPAAPSEHVPATNLPKDLPPLFGRDEDLAALRTLVDRHKLVTVVGAGGIGKSRLAQAVAHAAVGRWPDGVWMVELAGLSDAALVANAIARALDVTSASGDADAAREALVAALGTRTLLLVVDNCEHLLDAVATVIEAILRDAPGVTVLTTSQEPLRLPDEHQFRLAPLAVPADAAAASARDAGAVALFEARVRALDPRFALSEENLALVIDVCRRLDGLPLAVELAAARVGTLGLRAVRDKLDARFKLLTGGARATLRRHQTLRAALEWSHHLLNVDEQAVFRRVGAFAGGFTMEPAQSVAADDAIDEWAVLDHLSALVEKSLVVMDAGDPPRYRLLESARAFALERLADAGETVATLRRHALAMRDFLQRVDDANLDGELRTDQYAARVLPELDNLRAAYAWATGEAGDPAAAVALAAHAGSLIDYAVECQEWLLALEPQVERGGFERPLAARYWRALAASNMARRVPITRQMEAARRARDLYRELGRPRREFSSLTRLAAFLGVLGDHPQAQSALAEARALMRPDWPPEFRILMLRRESSNARSTRRMPEALALYRELIATSAATGDWRLEVAARNTLVDFAWESGPLEDAVREACALVDLVRARPASPSDMDSVYANAIGTLSEAGRIDEAVVVAAEGLPVMRQSRGHFLEEWVYLFWRLGAADAATRLLGALDAEQARIGTPAQPNERRLLAQARAGLATQVAPDAFASSHAAGATLGIDACFDLVARTLAEPRRAQ